MVLAFSPADPSPVGCNQTAAIHWNVLPMSSNRMATLKAPITSVDHIRGPNDAPVTLVEYGDYECPYCGAAHPIVKRVREHFGKKLRFVFRNFPITAMHPHAESAAETAEFAGAHGVFWNMHDGFFESQDRMGQRLLFTLVEAMGLSAPALQHALDTRAYTQKVRADFVGGVRSGVNGTPCFFVNNDRHDGSYAYEELVEAVDTHMPAKTTITR
jgi:protein-disulfide isomerase